MISFKPDLKILVASQPVDFRKSINGLAALVAEAFRDRLEMIAWDGTGMVLMTKWLEEGRFTWPPIRDGSVRLTATELTILLSGLDWTRFSRGTSCGAAKIAASTRPIHSRQRSSSWSPERSGSARPARSMEGLPRRRICTKPVVA